MPCPSPPFYRPTAPEICTSPLGATARPANIAALGTPVRTNDFSQSADEGPYMFPSMYASPGHRVQDPACPHPEHVVKSFTRIARTSRIRAEFRQISSNAASRTFPHTTGN